MQASFVDDGFFVSNDPGSPLRFLVDLARDIHAGIRNSIVVGASQQARPVDREAHERTGTGVLRSGHGKHTEASPLIVIGNPGIGAALRCDRTGLLCIVVGRTNPVALHIHSVILIADGAAVIVRQRRRAIAAPRSNLCPTKTSQQASPHPPPARPPRAEVRAIPAPTAVPATVIEIIAHAVAACIQACDGVRTHSPVESPIGNARDIRIASKPTSPSIVHSARIKRTATFSHSSAIQRAATVQASRATVQASRATVATSPPVSAAIASYSATAAAAATTTMRIHSPLKCDRLDGDHAQHQQRGCDRAPEA